MTYDNLKKKCKGGNSLKAKACKAGKKVAAMCEEEPDLKGCER
jgi:hypothetical protein